MAANQLPYHTRNQVTGPIAQHNFNAHAAVLPLGHGYCVCVVVLHRGKTWHSSCQRLCLPQSVLEKLFKQAYMNLQLMLKTCLLFRCCLR